MSNWIRPSEIPRDYKGYAWVASRKLLRDEGWYPPKPMNIWWEFNCHVGWDDGRIYITDHHCIVMLIDRPELPEIGEM